jgi:bifunctional DNA-binding transcriptional regulator/antitoxin component of YhaV-PrlF toxin-antitoxin module
MRLHIPQWIYETLNIKEGEIIYFVPNINNNETIITRENENSLKRIIFSTKIGRGETGEYYYHYASLPKKIIIKKLECSFPENEQGKLVIKTRIDY